MNTPHDYISTACQHGLHARCRRTCKFCGVACNCNCGHPEPQSTELNDTERKARAFEWLERHPDVYATAGSGPPTLQTAHGPLDAIDSSATLLEAIEIEITREARR